MKNHPISRTNQALLTALQQGVPFVRRPWAAMARTLGMTETKVLSAARGLFERGVARRFGAVLDSRRLGYAGTLCAVDVPDLDIARVAALFQPHPGVTHCYEREGRPNLWFTLTMPADRLDDELRRIGDMLKPYSLLNLPALRRFKVEVVLDAAEDGVEPARDVCHRRIPGRARAGRLRRKIMPDMADGDTPPMFSGRDKFLIRKIQDNLPLTEEPFWTVAQELQWDPNELLQRLTSWKQTGILRRIGFILRHRAAGFMANGMCVWPVVEADVVRAGRFLAGCHEVTHCYERPSPPSFPFNLFAMIHARERGAAEDTFRRLSERAALTGGRMLISLREFKKSSPVFFLEDSPWLASMSRRRSGRSLGDETGGKAPA